MNTRNHSLNYGGSEKYSFSKEENSISSKRKLELPLIGKEYFPRQKSIKVFNKFLENKNYKLNSKEIRKKIFLTSSKYEEPEEEENNIFTKTNNEKKRIKKILYDRIIINNNLLSQENKNKLFQRNLILKKYMNEAILYRKSIFQNKKINVGKLLNVPYSYDKRNEILEDLNQNKKTIDTSINSNLIIDGPTKMKKFKTLDKNLVISKSIDFSKMNRNKLNCNLKYKFNKNHNKIKEINNILNNLEEETKATFDGYRNQANIIIDKAKQTII